MRPHGALSLARYAPRSGARVLDVGCGRGESTLDLARLVGPKGSVVGLDACDATVEAARREARALGARNVTLVCGDARTFRSDDPSPFDLVFVRMGRHALGDPESALRNVRHGSKPGGRLLVVTWRTLAQNPWATVTAEVSRLHARCFALADPEMARAVLARAGYVDVTLEPIDAPVVLGTSVDEAAATLVRTAAIEADAAADRLESEVRVALRRFVTPRGVVMGSSTWCITATTPS